MLEAERQQRAVLAYYAREAARQDGVGGWNGREASSLGGLSLDQFRSTRKRLEAAGMLERQHPSGRWKITQRGLDHGR